MNRIKLHTMLVIACAVGMSLLGGSTWAVFTCPTLPPGPKCRAHAGMFCSNSVGTPCNIATDCPSGGTCSIAIIDGTADATPNNVTNITISGSAQLTLTHSALGGNTATFHVTWNNTVSPAAGVVTAQSDASGNPTTPVSVRFSTRGAVDAAVHNEIICSDGPYTFTAVSVTNNPVEPTGQNACAGHLFSCDDGSPPLDHLAPNPQLDLTNATVFSVASPIHSITPGDVTMEMHVNGPTVDAHLRLAFARSTDHGATYGPFADATTLLGAGSTRIIGTGEWSSIRVAVATSPNNSPITIFPSLSAWGRALLVLLMSSAVMWFSWRYATKPRQVSRHP
jgi:hypothetical protein